jgi:hypothetical protein
MPDANSSLHTNQSRDSGDGVLSPNMRKGASVVQERDKTCLAFVHRVRKNAVHDADLRFLGQPVALLSITTFVDSGGERLDPTKNLTRNGR